MRRVASILLLILGGWILASGIMMMWLDFEPTEPGMKLAMITGFALFSLPFLLLGAWASPGKRWAELGLTLMITAGVGAAVALMMLAMFMDPSFTKLLPPDRPLPDIKFSPIAGAAVSLLVGAGGYLLRRLTLQRP